MTKPAKPPTPAPIAELIALAPIADEPVQPVLGDRSAVLTAAIATPGIARQLNPLDGAQLAAGGGDLNGSASQAIRFGQAGTAGNRIGVPRQDAGNFTGVV